MVSALCTQGNIDEAAVLGVLRNWVRPGVTIQHVNAHGEYDPPKAADLIVREGGKIVSVIDVKFLRGWPRQRPLRIKLHQIEATRAAALRCGPGVRPVLIASPGDLNELYSVNLNAIDLTGTKWDEVCLHNDPDELYVTISTDELWDVRHDRGQLCMLDTREG